VVFRATAERRGWSRAHHGTGAATLYVQYCSPTLVYFSATPVQQFQPANGEPF